MSALAVQAPHDAQTAALWDDCLLAARLLAVDPAGLGGVAVRAAPSPLRDLWLSYLRGLLAPGAPVRRLPAGIGDDRLLGGIDLAATLKAGRPVIQHGVLIEADGGLVIVPMAERMGAGTAARIASALDRGEVAIERDGIATRAPAAIGIVALDEGAVPEEQLPPALAARLAMHLDLNGLGVRGCLVPQGDAILVAKARARLGGVAPVTREIVEALVKTALSFGIGSVAVALLALKAARAACALAARDGVTMEDAAVAARLVLAPRATQLPQDAADEEPQQQQDRSEQPNEDGDEDRSPESLDDMLCEAVQAVLPPGLLESLKSGKDRAAPGPRDGSGNARMSLLRGRPLGARAGAMRAGARLALVDTLRAAAPWQPVRRAERGGSAKIEVRREDFRIRQFAQRRESSIVFCVDASGSAAFHRLAEAKGAVELLLGEAYVARTYAALVAFRGTAADILLPPSRSLTRAKALLSTLPGGGGTPLAHGIAAAAQIAIAERAKGRQPLIVFLTDGQANIARDGKAARAAAFADAMTAARLLAAQKIASVFVDTSPRARDEGRTLAAAMDARYLALPHVQAAAVRDAVRAAQ